MEEIKYIKLSELATQIEGVIKNAFASYYWVIAEISGHKFYPNQDRHYFDLIEKLDNSNTETAKIKGKSWTEGSRNISHFERVTGQKFGNGLQVLIKVKVEYHIVYGLSITLFDIDTSYTLGNIEKQRQETLARLVRENAFISFVNEEYITNNKTLALNKVLQHIAVIGSSNSEGYADFIHTLTSNKFGYTFQVDVYHSSVQGVEAETELVNTLGRVYHSKKPYDCVVLIRGGGAKTDFLVFDTYRLSQGVAKFPIPIITGIGHHKDVSIVDMMAHTATKTPTKSAEFIISHNHTFEESLLISQKSIIIKSQSILSAQQQSIAFLNSKVVNNSRTLISHSKDSLNGIYQTIINKSRQIIYNNKEGVATQSRKLVTVPIITIGAKSKDLSNTSTNLKGYLNKYLINKRGYLGHYAKIISLIGPEKTLKRGFAMIMKDGKVVSNPDVITPNDNLNIVLSSAEINTKVISKSNRNESNI